MKKTAAKKPVSVVVPAVQSLTDADFRPAIKMFFKRATHDHAVEKWGPIADWDVSAVTDMEGTFQGQSEFNEDISRWNVSNVTTMTEMFFDASQFNQDLTGWDVSNVRCMNEMFFGARKMRSYNNPVGGPPEYSDDEERV